MKTHKFIYFHDLRVSKDLTWLKDNYDVMLLDDIDKEIAHSQNDLEHEGGDQEWYRFNQAVIHELTALKEMMLSRSIMCIVFEPEKK